MAKRRPPTIHGLAIVDKPAGVTSHDVINQLRKHLGERRIGHAGTLDPDATGVLLVGVGYATRLLQFLGGLDKTYTGEIVLGTETNTLDSSGTVTATFDMSDVTLQQARDAARQLTGEILQVPPMVSALKIGGKRLHDLARQGIEIERQARPVTVYEFEVSEGGETGALRLKVRCSAGTYVRTLAADLGGLLGGGAYLRNLRRVAVGEFDESQAHPPDDVQMLPAVTAVRDLTQVVVDDETAAMIRNGRVLERWVGQPPWAILDGLGALLAVYEPFGDGQSKPVVVLAEAIA
ncbi:MAG: tRNA pseudouridine(55) synthase TruB [Ilumatobacteraceae bacterium]